MWFLVTKFRQYIDGPTTDIQMGDVTSHKKDWFTYDSWKKEKNCNRNKNSSENGVLCKWNELYSVNEVKSKLFFLSY